MREKFGKDLSSTEVAVADLIQEQGIVVTHDIMERFSLSERGAQRVLRRLIEKGVAEKVGAGRSTRYRLVTLEEDA